MIAFPLGVTGHTTEGQMRGKTGALTGFVSKGALGVQKYSNDYSFSLYRPSQGTSAVSGQADRNEDVKLDVTGNNYSASEGRKRGQGKSQRPVPSNNVRDSSLGCQRQFSSAAGSQWVNEWLLRHCDSELQV